MSVCRSTARWAITARACASVPATASAPLGARVVPAADVAAPDALAVRVEIDGVVAQRTSTGDRVRGVARLIADVTEFMTLHPGDVLLLGAAAGGPQVRAGQTAAVTIEGLGTLRNRFIAASDAEAAE